MIEDDRKEFNIERDKPVRFYLVKNPLNQDISYYPSVTTILSTGKDMFWWYKKEQYAKEITLHANTVGTFAHYKLQAQLASMWGLSPPDLSLSNEQQRALDSWFTEFPFTPSFKKEKPMSFKHCIDKIDMIVGDWIFQMKPKPPIQSNGREYNIYPFEIKNWSDRYGYAGSMDVLASLERYNNENYVVDIKTNDKQPDDYYMQCTAYQIGVLEQHPDLVIKGIKILNLPKDEPKKGCDFDYRFTDPPANKDYRKMWLHKVFEFYNKYGDTYPLNLHKERILKNLKEDGIENFKVMEC